MTKLRFVCSQPQLVVLSKSLFVRFKVVPCKWILNETPASAARLG